MSYKLSKKQIVAEIMKCGKDPVYFTNNYARISHPIKGLIPFRTYPYQADLLSDFNDYRFNVILKARQLGISTIALITLGELSCVSISSKFLCGVLSNKALVMFLISTFFTYIFTHVSIHVKIILFLLFEDRRLFRFFVPFDFRFEREARNDFLAVLDIRRYIAI